MAVQLEAGAAKKARVHQQYFTKDGTLVPGTTTITGVLDKGDGLKIWANKLGLQGIQMREYVDALAEIGTLAHAMMLESLGGEPWDRRAYSPDQVDRAENAFLKYLEWAKGKTLESVLIEKPLVSEMYRYGGTVDWYGRINGVPTLLDIKTAKAVYDEHFTQVAAYRQLLVEHGHPVDVVRILQVGRSEDEGFTDPPLRHGELHFALFRHCLAIYEIRRRLKNGGRA